MDHEFFMQLAINKAKEGILNGQTPFGACIVKDNNVISCSHNTVWLENDITNHAEIVVIKEACKKLATIDLSNCIIYSTCEPCPMCFSACHWAKIKTIYYGSSISDAQKAGFSELSISNKTMKDEGKSKINIVSHLLLNENLSLLALWEKQANKKTY